jgi:parallel beta-helix repeat protein
LTLAFAPSPQSDEGWREAGTPAGPASTLSLAGVQPADVAGATIEVFDSARSRNGFTRAVEILKDGAAVKLAPFYPEPVTDVGRYRLLGHPAWVTSKGYFGWDKKNGVLLAAPFDPQAGEADGIRVPVLESLLILHGAQDIRIEGLSFGETGMAVGRELESAAVVLEDSHRVVIAGNDFRNIGQAVRLIGASDNIVARNAIAEAAASAIELQDGSDHNSILDNKIQGTGRIEKAAAAIYLHGASANRLAGNLISDTGGRGIAIDNWDDQTINLGNVVENNRLRSTSRETFDTGAIEMLGRSGRNTASIIRDNDIRDAGPQPKADDHLFPASGIYLDDLTSGVLVCGNHIRGAPLAAIQIHGGSDVTVRSNVAFLDRPHSAFVFLQAADPRSGGERYAFVWPSEAQSGTTARHRLEIRFDNDAVVGGEDRDLFVSRVEVAGRVYAAGGSGAVYRLTDGRVLPGQVSLPWDGTLMWDLPIDAGQGQAVPVSVFAWGNPAGGVGPHVTVSIDGMRLGDAYVGRADEMRGNTIERNVVYAAAPAAELLRSHSGGHPTLTENAYVEPDNAQRLKAGKAPVTLRAEQE